VSQAGDEVDGGRQDNGPQEVGQERVAQGGAADRVGFQFGIGDLEGHSEGEGQVGEIGVPGCCLLVTP